MTTVEKASKLTILEALADPRLFGRAFQGGSWAAWQSFLAALFALPLSPTELTTYQQHTGREAPSPLRLTTLRSA